MGGFSSTQSFGLGLAGRQGPEFQLYHTFGIFVKKKVKKN
jgi:hypothetical protein